MNNSAKKTIAFIDGQNLFYAVKEAFGYKYPNYDVLKLARRICEKNGWNLEQTHFYTGIPSPLEDAYWHSFWTKKLMFMGRSGIIVHSRPLSYY